MAHKRVHHVPLQVRRFVLNGADHAQTGAPAGLQRWCCLGHGLSGEEGVLSDKGIGSVVERLLLLLDRRAGRRIGEASIEALVSSKDGWEFRDVALGAAGLET